MDIPRLLLFTVLWTALWTAPLPRGFRRFELVAGLTPFCAFGLRVFAGFFVGVPADDPVRMAVGPLLDWVNGRVGAVPYQWVLDGTVGIGLLWLASAFDIPRSSRIATMWIMPVAALASLVSFWLTGLPLETMLASWMPAMLLAVGAAGLIAGVIRWTPGPIEVPVRQSAAIAALLILPGAVAVGSGLLAVCKAMPVGQAAADSVVSLTTGLLAGSAAAYCCQFQRVRSRLLFAMAVGVAAGAVVSQKAGATRTYPQVTDGIQRGRLEDGSPAGTLRRGPSNQTRPVVDRPPLPFAAGGSWIDLTHPFDERTIYWPTENGFSFEPGDNGPTPKGYYYAANRFASAEHGGTHLDAPRHFSAVGETTDAIPLDRLVGEAVVIDVSRQCAADATYEVSADDLVAWEERHRRQLVDVIVLIRTGWSSRWPDREAYLGTAAVGPAAVAALRFPGLAPTAARWLADHRRVRAIGIDTASIDHGPSTHFGAHVALCGANIPVFENVAAVERLPEEGAFVAALPMKIAGGSGGPLRIVARLPDGFNGRSVSAPSP
jgi:kynurenine formamidase/uncharacterized protein YfiM (DUF2279 family)